MHEFLKFVLGMKLYMFRTVPVSIIRSFSLYTHQWYMSYSFADSLRVGAYAPACKLSIKPYDIYHCCVYSEKFLMMDILLLLASCQQNCMTYTIGVCTVKNS